MKAKEYAERLISLVEKHEEFENELEKCLRALCQDADNLIKIRRAKSDQSVAACINEINSKWMAIINCYRKTMENKYKEWASVMYPTLLEDGFKAAYVHLHPNRGWYFNLSRHKQWCDEKNASVTKPKAMNTMPYRVTPYEELKFEDLTMEILACLTSLGNMAEMGIPVMALKPLAFRITLLRYWVSKGSIDLTDVEAMNSYEDPRKFFDERGFMA